MSEAPKNNQTPAADRPDWASLKAAWPNSDHSNFMEAGGLVWHVQKSEKAKAPSALLVHGTGAATHSMSALFDALEEHFTVMAIDLPGHGFTASAPYARLSLPGMAAGLEALLKVAEFAPDICIGHSAGSAVLLEMVAEKQIEPSAIITINAALKPIEGNTLFSPLAKMLFANPLTPRIFAMQAQYTSIAANLLSGTNSPINDQAKELYKALMSNPAHVNGALGMMANWELQPLVDKLSKIKIPVRFIVAKDDKMVPPSVSREAAERLEDADVIAHDTGGHLLHEVSPESVVAEIEKLIAQSKKETSPVAEKVGVAE
ncbi:MAG: alpha/beta fold hydrolase BchO [Pseudomonadota bacterium]